MIELRLATKKIRGSDRVILDGLDLMIEVGEFCILIGANGSGKSSLLKVISQEINLDRGELICRGSTTQVVQDVNRGIIPSLSLFENIVLSNIKVPKFRAYKRYRHQILEKLGQLDANLPLFIDKPMYQLSGGQKQLVATMMAFNRVQDVLLLDEHTSALDPKMQKVLMNYTAREIHRRKLTTLMITHNMHDAIVYGDRLLMLHQGRIVHDFKGQTKKDLQASDLVNLFQYHQGEDHEF
jgi:putative tryptophan/tyrosine transport system ATP-binding protein